MSRRMHSNFWHKSKKIQEAKFLCGQHTESIISSPHEWVSTAMDLSMWQTPFFGWADHTVSQSHMCTSTCACMHACLCVCHGCCVMCIMWCTSWDLTSTFVFAGWVHAARTRNNGSLACLHHALCCASCKGPVRPCLRWAAHWTKSGCGALVTAHSGRAASVEHHQSGEKKERGRKQEKEGVHHQGQDGSAERHG